MLDTTLKEQVKTIFADLSSAYLFDVYVSNQHENRAELLALLEDTASCSDKIRVRVNEVADGLAFKLLKDGQDVGLCFRMVPNGHEFSTLLLAVLNADGKGKNIPDAFIQRRVKGLKGEIRLSTYVSLTCTNCPDVAQALNLMVILNPHIRHEIIDGALCQEDVSRLGIQGVPAVFADDAFFHSGKGGFGELLEKLEAKYGSKVPDDEAVETKMYDVIVVGGGPAGATAAIYSARKGLKVAVLAERVGGQVKETVGIENVPSVVHTTGEQLANDLKTHVLTYPVDLFENRTVEKIEVTPSGEEGTPFGKVMSSGEGMSSGKIVHVKGGETFCAPALIIATGASWRRLNVAGESQYIGKGVAFCPHCDGPFYKGKRVAVIGGGNSGVEAAIDLAGICSEVTVFEFLESLKADEVLQEKLRSLPNTNVYANRQTTALIGDGQKLTAIRVKDRATNEEKTMELDGVFVQIGLTANSSVFKDIVKTNRIGEIETDAHCRTNVPGIYAAGDVSTVPYKQIVISMGEGAKAALTAFDDRIRGLLG